MSDPLQGLRVTAAGPRELFPEAFNQMDDKPPPPVEGCGVTRCQHPTFGEWAESRMVAIENIENTKVGQSEAVTPK